MTIDTDLPPAPPVPPLGSTPRTTLTRLPDRAATDRAMLNDLLDEALLAHIAFADDGQPVVLPIACWRAGDHLYIHGARKTRFMQVLAGGAPASVAVTVLDGLVIARSTFNHSMNYRSAIIFGRFEPVDDPVAKAAALDAFMRHVVPGRDPHEPRPGSDQELKATHVLRIALDEVSVKWRAGPPGDQPQDMDRPVWAGVVPLALTAGTPITAPSAATRPVPPEFAAYRRPSGCARG
ncbi:pyridoxamine 5'-phosphate oxidase family protein [Tistrella bauzanensis]|uniref:pyridoxamine 5'-phosphate oxidase family protein n=1 Tax=Tistrella TaxID=171436 RepID=UPI0031F648CD